MKLDYHVVYSKRKTLNLSVERDGSVVVRAPLGTPEDKIRRVIEVKRLWLYQKVNHEKKYPPERRRKEFVSGETILYLGRNYRLEITENNLPGVQFHWRFLLSRKNQPNAARLFRQWYQARSQERLPNRAKYFAEAMGVAFKKVLVSDMRVRWGSCTPSSNLNFNWRIMRAPTSVIDYVIVHELAHLLEPNHTQRFWHIVAVQVPHCERAKEWLREHGGVLEGDF